jgi:hypothetical protein
MSGELSGCRDRKRMERGTVSPAGVGAAGAVTVAVKAGAEARVGLREGPLGEEKTPGESVSLPPIPIPTETPEAGVSRGAAPKKKEGKRKRKGRTQCGSGKGVQENAGAQCDTLAKPDDETAVVPMQKGTQAAVSPAAPHAEDTIVARAAGAEASMLSGSFLPIGVGAAGAVTTALAIGAAVSRREGAVPPAAADERGAFVVAAAGAEASKEGGAVLPDRWGAVSEAETVLKAGVKAISEEGAVAPATAGLGEETVLRGAVAQGGLTLAAAVTAERAVTVATEMGAKASKGFVTIVLG